MAAPSISRRKAIILAALLISVWSYLGYGRPQHMHVPAASAQQLKAAMPLASSWPARDLAYITSPSKVFCFGWLQVPRSSANFYVAVYYAGLDGAIVWAANRDSPAAANDTLQLTSDGSLLLVSASRPLLIWQNNSSAGAGGASALQILDSGNAVLLSANGSYSWQSFSSPTDTLLPSQPFLVSAELISRSPAFPFSPASGNFKFYINQEDSIRASVDYINTSTGSSVQNLWRAPDLVPLRVDAVDYRSLIAAQFLKQGVFCMYNTIDGAAYSMLVSEDYGAVPSRNQSVFRRLTLDADGNLRMYGWDYVSETWIVLSQAIASICSELTDRSMPACGPYGVCLNAPTPACACPPGFHPTRITDASSGCTPDNSTLPDCPNDKSSASTYLALYSTDFPFNDISSVKAIGLADCQSRCTKLCTCVGVVHDNSGSATCWLKSKLVNGLSPVSARDVYMKVQKSTNLAINDSHPHFRRSLTWINSSSFWSQTALDSSLSASCSSSGIINNTALTCNQTSSHSNKATIIVAALVSFGAGLLVCFVLVLLLRRKADKSDEASRSQPVVCRAFTFEELTKATKDFTHRLGAGAFGTVFKGILSDRTEVAVKRLQASPLQIAEAQFRAEIATIGRIHHMNLLRLYGYCTEGPDKRLLVYEFMENGSLNKVLFAGAAGVLGADGSGTNGRNRRRPMVLDWRTRYGICLGTARGLAYLHEECLDCIVHCDIKPENILLDQQFCPRVADFGLAYLFGRNETLEVSNVRGTRGYLAPEWVTYLPITAKADVFSYGVVLIELVSGQRNSQSASSGRWQHSRWASQLVRDGQIEKVVDHRIRDQVMADDAQYAEVERMLRIAFMCLQQSASARPSMRSVVQMLEGAIAVPAFSALEALESDDPSEEPDSVDSQLSHGPIMSSQIPSAR